MGITINLYLIKDISPKKSLNTDIVLKKLHVKSEVLLQGIDFEDVLSTLWERNSAALIGLSYYNNHFIVIDDYLLFKPVFFESFTREYHTSLLQAQNSDTVGICDFSYYENGVLLRRQSLGNENWREEMKAAGLEVSEDGDNEPDQVGEPLAFEKNGNDALSVIHTYGIGHDKLYELKWELRKVIEE
jgi:hypothetical protein